MGLLYQFIIYYWEYITIVPIDQYDNYLSMKCQKGQ